MNPNHDPVHLTQALVRMNTINTPGDESSCTRYLAELLEPWGFTCTLTELAPGRASLIARIEQACELYQRMILDWCQP